MVTRWIVLTIISDFPRQVLFYVPLFAAEIKGANQFIIGGMSTASSLVFVFLALPLGHLADSLGRKKVIVVAAGLVCISYLMLIYSINYLFLLVSGFLGGFRMTVGQSQMAISADLVPKKYMGSWFGVLGFFRGLMGVFSPIVCGLLWTAVSPQSVFFLLVLMLFLLLLLFQFFF